MSDPQVRREIALRAAQLMYTRDEAEYFHAKRKAARLVTGTDHVRDLPSNAEIREHVQLLAMMLEGETRGRKLAAMRLEALFFLRLLERHRPVLIGSVLTGHVREGSDIDLHAFCDSPGVLADEVQRAGFPCEIERKRVEKGGEERVYTHVHVRSRHAVEITVYPAAQHAVAFRSSITGKAIERGNARVVEGLIREASPGLDIDAELEALSSGACVDEEGVWEAYLDLLRPLERVKQSARFHAEGDALFHSLQVFDLARRERPYDAEFMLAALLHDVGKAIDPVDHVGAGLAALDGLVPERTAWLIEHHMEAHALRAGTLGARARRRLVESPDYEDLVLLSEIDRAGRVPGAVVPSVEEAIEFIRKVSDGSDESEEPAA